MGFETSPLAESRPQKGAHGAAMTLPRFYTDLADWWPLLSAPADYAEEAAFYQKALLEACEGDANTRLELGSGGGNNASHMKQRFALTLVDPAPGMLAVSRELNPECEHAEGDMRTVRLEREFDCVFVHDAVCYMQTEADLRAAIETAVHHCRTGGTVLLAPDYVKENFREGTGHGGHDGDGRSLRYLEWVWDPDPEDNTYVADYVFALRESDGEPRVVQDRHVEGLFPRSTWIGLLAELGVEATALSLVHSELPEGTHEVFVGRKTGA